MKSSRNQLILLGFLCQGLSFDNYVLPLAYLALWFLCLKWPRPRQPLRPNTEALLLVGGCAVSFAAARIMGQSVHFFLGHGLVLIQAARLMRPLTHREKRISFLIATFHLAVACTFLFDTRFFLVLLPGLVLIPRALLEMETERFLDPEVQPKILPAAAGVGPKLSLGVYVAVGVAMVAVFLFFPRAFLRPPSGSRLGDGEPISLLDASLDPSRSALARSSRVLFQVEGQDVGYLRCFSLIDFDGKQWTTPPHPPLRALPFLSPENRGSYLHRRVRVTHAGYLGRTLPVDGAVVSLIGRFFGRPLANAHGGIETDSMWNTPNNIYEYWIDPRPKVEPLVRAQKKLYTQLPEISERVKGWLEEQLAEVDDPLAQARQLERVLRSNFRYELGAPRLNEREPLEDFLFNQKRGHCERFASTLAVMLRLKGIPSRVVLGYAPSGRNWLSGAYNVRFKDAHAWTEAYFEDRGWVQLDATPRASFAPESFDWRDWLADADFAFSSYVVSLDAVAQSRWLSSAVQAVVVAPGWLSRHWGTACGVALGFLLVELGRRALPGLVARLRARSVQPPAVVFAEHCYGQMLGALAKLGFEREPTQTPFEFVKQLEARSLQGLEDVRLITDHFCAVRYGHFEAPPDDVSRMRQALARLKALKPSLNRGAVA